jgi:hypothetical protein
MVSFSMAKKYVFIGGFFWAISTFLLIIGIFLLQQYDETVTSNHYEILIGYIGANILSLLIAGKEFSASSSYSTYEGGDSFISAISGFSLAGFIDVLIWLFLASSPVSVLTIGLLSSVLAFAGIILVGKFWNADLGY